MIIETVTAQAVSLRISREELGARDTITPGEARAAVARALAFYKSLMTFIRPGSSVG